MSFVRGGGGEQDLGAGLSGAASKENISARTPVSKCALTWVLEISAFF